MKSLPWWRFFIIAIGTGILSLAIMVALVNYLRFRVDVAQLVSGVVTVPLFFILARREMNRPR